MGRAGVAVIGVLALFAAACSDGSALGSPDNEAPLGPTVLSSGEAADDPDGAGALAENTGGGASIALEDPPAPTLTIPQVTTPPLPTPPPTPPPPDPVTVIAAGNLGGCNAHTNEVAAALADVNGTIFAVGDLSTNGTQDALDECFLAALGSDLDRVYAVPGDRDLQADDGAAFYALTGQTPTNTASGEGWFVTSLGGWQIIGLNSQCESVGGCDQGSAQYQWLDQLLREQPAACRAVIWHDARFTSAKGEKNAADLGPLLGRLDGAGIDVLITGSPGNYERLGPLRPNGQRAGDNEPGTMHFNIGAGSNAGFAEQVQPGSVTRKDAFNGYVRFVFAPEGYTWEFVATSEGSSTPDIGARSCESSGS